MRITLFDIEKAIRANFILAKDGKCLLEVEDIRKRCPAAARIVFVGVALDHEHKTQEICDYLDLTLTDFNSKIKRFRKSIETGAAKMNKKRETGNLVYDDNFNLEVDMYIYRKTVLVRNYLISLQREAAILF